jgi:hypothetical protein
VRLGVAGDGRKHFVLRLGIAQRAGLSHHPRIEHVNVRIDNARHHHGLRRQPKNFSPRTEQRFRVGGGTDKENLLTCHGHALRDLTGFGHGADLADDNKIRLGFRRSGSV